MTPEDQAQLQQSIDTIAQILYRNTPAEQLPRLLPHDLLSCSHSPAIPQS